MFRLNACTRGVRNRSSASRRVSQTGEAGAFLCVCCVRAHTMTGVDAGKAAKEGSCRRCKQTPVAESKASNAGSRFEGGGGGSPSVWPCRCLHWLSVAVG